MRTPGPTADRAPIVSSHSPHIRLAVVAGPGAGQTIELRRVVSIIGSGENCKVRLKHPDVSTVHCAIVNNGEEIYLRDLASRHGTLLNDLKAVHERIEDGDVLAVRPWLFRAQVPRAEQVPDSDFTGLGLDPAPVAIALQDPTSGAVTKLPREVSLLGRRSACDHVIEDRSVSRAHALICSYLAKVFVVDLHSHNGTFVNEERVAFGELVDGDILKVGTVERIVKPMVTSPRLVPTGNGQAARPAALQDSISDRIDIRAAEIEPKGGRR